MERATRLRYITDIGDAMVTKRNAIRFSMSVVLALSALPALAQPGGEPLVLDTQTGIHSGAGGTVLQTGPLTHHEMVQAPSVAGVPGEPQQNQPVIEVTPYIGVPQQRGAWKPSGTPSSSRQQHAHAAPSRPGTTPLVTAPIAVAPMVAATRPQQSSGPHVSSGAITAQGE
jgi:hypothetical protein